MNKYKGEINMTDRELLEKMFDKINGMESKINSMESKLNETLEIVKALEHKADVNKAEHDNMFNKMAHIEGHLKNIDGSIEVMKDFIGHHQVDIEILKRRPV